MRNNCELRLAHTGWKDSRAIGFAIGLALWAQTLPAQSVMPGGLGAYSSGRNGFGLYSATATSGYYQGEVPFGGGTSLNTSGDILFSGNVSMGWRRHGERNHLSLVYSPGFFTRYQYPGQYSLNHNLSLNLSRMLSPRWRFSATGAGVYSSVEQMWYGSSSVGAASALNATADELASATLQNPISSSNIGPQLGVSPAGDLPTRLLFYGDRLVSASVSVGLSFVKSSRTTISFNGTGSRNQSLPSEGRPSGNQSLLEKSTSGGADVVISHTLSTKTTLGVSGSFNNTFGNRLDSQGANLTAFAGRKLGVRWFGQVRGGAAWLENSRVTANVVPIGSIAKGGLSYVAGGSLGYRGYANGIFLSANRSFGDTYGLGSTVNYSAGLGWTYGRPSGKWRANANSEYVYFSGSALANSSGWVVNGQVSRRVSTHLSAGIQAVLNRSLVRGGTLPQVEQRSISAFLTWSQLVPTERN